MADIGPLERVAARLRRAGRLGTPMERTVQLATTRPVSNPAHASFEDMAGMPMEPVPGAMPGEDLLAALGASRPLLRRRVLSDLLAGEPLGTFHETGRSGAAAPTMARARLSGADPKERYARIRREYESALFGNADPESTLYGYLTRDPADEVRRMPLEMQYPDSGTILRPDNPVWQYGRYGVRPRPEVDARTTFTLGDSIDSLSGASPGTMDLVPYRKYSRVGDEPNHVVWPGSVLDRAAQEYDAREAALARRVWGTPWAGANSRETWAQRAQAEADWIKWQKTYSSFLDPASIVAARPWLRLTDMGSFWDAVREAGLPNFGEELRAAGAGYTPANTIPAMTPRGLRSPTGSAADPLPFTPREMGALRGYARDPTPRGFAGYVETQMHGGLRPEDIEAVYDFGAEPSSTLERKLRKLGIEYRPLVGPDDVLMRLRRLPKGATHGDLVNAARAGPDPLAIGSYLENYIAKMDESRRRNMKGSFSSLAEEPAPRITDHYAGGGRVVG